MKYLLLVAAGWLLSACAYSSSLDVASDTIQVTTEAAPVCDQAGAQKVAAQRAAIETLKRGYDRYVIMEEAYQNNVGVIFTTPIIANSYGSGTVNSYGNSATYNGQPHGRIEVDLRQRGRWKFRQSAETVAGRADLISPG